MSNESNVTGNDTNINKDVNMDKPSERHFYAPNFLITKQFILEDMNLSLHEAVLYAYIYEMYDSTREVDASNWYLGKLIRVQPRQVQRYLESLITKGYLRREEVSERERLLHPIKKLPNAKIINSDNSVDNSDQNTDPPCHERHTPHVMNDIPPMSSMTYNNIDNKIGNNIVDLESNRLATQDDKDTVRAIQSLVARKLSDKTLTHKQAIEIKKLHAVHKDMTLLQSIEWSLDNLNYYVDVMKGHLQKSKVGLFIATIRKEKFFGDKRVCTVDKAPREDSEMLQHQAEQDIRNEHYQLAYKFADHIDDFERETILGLQQFEADQAIREYTPRDYLGYHYYKYNWPEIKPSIEKKYYRKYKIEHMLGLNTQDNECLNQIRGMGMRTN